MKLYRITYRTPPGEGQSGELEHYVVASSARQALDLLEDEVGEITFVDGERVFDDAPLDAREVGSDA